MSKKHVVVGISGGVDSAVAAYLLKEQGHQITGVFMQNWEADFDDPYCTAQQDLTDARSVCEQLDIPFKTINFAKQYWDNVFQVCLDEFNAGRTPNPDIWCNKEIKFKVFLQHALELGADAIATGHYVKKTRQGNQWLLNKGDDDNKDQSYFLYTLNQEQLGHALFPLAELTKPQIRQVASELKLSNATKKDSTGICFIGERNFKNFLSEYLLGTPGDIVTTENEVVGQHDGLLFYTLGQRKGLNIGGLKNHHEGAWYVVAKLTEKNQLVIGQGHDHPALFNHRLSCDNLHWVSGNAPQLPLSCTAKTRYRQEDQACTVSVSQNNENELNVCFEKAQWAITPGQSVVFYQGAACLGGGTITQAIK